MSEKFRCLPILFIVGVLVAGLALAGCSTSGTGQPAGQGQTSPPASTGTTTTGPSNSSSGQASQPSSGTGAPQGFAIPPDMSKMLSRAAQILGISESQFSSAFQQASESVFGKMQIPPSSGAGQKPPAPPVGGTDQQPPVPPTGSTGQQPPTPPSGMQGPGDENMLKVYSKMAELLSISADKISSAMDQARQELAGMAK